MFDHKTILVTGGTGSFGNDFVRLVLAEHRPKRVVVFSRDEKKQHDMRLALADDRVAFVIGDVRDAAAVTSAMRGVDYVFHAAALKQVPSCEFFPIEAVKTNVIGAHNVLEAAEQCGVEKLVVLSTDKAVYPINAMGQTKALMEKLTLARARAPGSQTTYCGVRYGNVMYSRGSVIPLFIQQIKSGKPLTITEPKMTRLLLPLADAVTLVTFAMEHGEQGDLLVRKAPAATVQDLAEALLRLFEADNPIDVVGVRAGEKLHEVLVTAEELTRAQEFDDYYRVACDGDRDYDKFFVRGERSAAFARDGYTSENARRLSVDETAALLMELPEVRAELNGWRSNATPRRAAA
ncbi:UDP-glucose 4-epimerase [Pirellulimonas nuda]|uniref:UDP-glucose 4-epimerase n=1 Tax=Pirellulimonas nuda TaxID=2528009 RepID=A0A518D7H3_9BACT|nr:polysaccharide biosynthesis protein [Pirellulimonas nuda]QDU87399.1 UDP-glucose 4-epimerase [Pirellulimonas nuda]